MARETLLKERSGSAVGSTRQRARVSMGRREESERREWRAQSLADAAAREGGGDGCLRRLNFGAGLVGIPRGAGGSSGWTKRADAVDWRRRYECICCW